MITLNKKVIMNFAKYIPSIKFLGPRNQLAPAPIPSSSDQAANTTTTQ